MLGFDAIAMVVALWAALAWRYETWTPNLLAQIGGAQWVVLLLVLTLVTAHWVGLYRSITRYMGKELVSMTLQVVVVSTLLLTALMFLSENRLPRTVVFLYPLFLALAITLSRWIARDYLSGGGHSQRKSKKAAIYGAGAAGFQLSLLLEKHPELNVVCFLDDEPTLQGARVNGLPVFSPSELDGLIRSYQLTDVLLALPNITRPQRKQIMDGLEPHALRVYTVPTLEDITSGRARLDDIREVELEDLLGRDPVPPIESLLSACIADKVVMVTGAGGSIGSELCRQILQLGPRQLLLVDASEFALFEIETELLAGEAQEGSEGIIGLLGNVQDQDYMRRIMQRYGVDTIYHAAAYKHVPLVEHNVIEGVRNNIFGTYAPAQAALEAGVGHFVLVSTDKAVRPTNVMGATKRFAELILQAIASQSPDTCFTMVRFGNVLGSSGSVVPLFRSQIRSGGPVTLTHPEITRFFMTIPEAAQLVIQAGAMGHGGDVFVLDMGEPVKILDLARRMIRLMGLSVRSIDEPDGEIAIEYTGLRPGEKLYEELLIGDEVQPTQHAKIMRALESSLDPATLARFINAFDTAVRTHDAEQLRTLLSEAVHGYTTAYPLVDHLTTKKGDRFIFSDVGDASRDTKI
ncbi:polysaccharide biosynthesis protein [Ectothiorhodosinus mongolicus]|nr:nucleoside-diphosphate sugar epimerase/dehydratase [Ectothiorhodosinus mongolicus]